MTAYVGEDVDTHLTHNLKNTESSLRVWAAFNFLQHSQGLLTFLMCITIYKIIIKMLFNIFSSKENFIVPQVLSTVSGIQGCWHLVLWVLYIF